MKIPVLIPTFILLHMLCAGCSKEEEYAGINESEIFFNEQLSSITVDGSDCFIGTEDGTIYRYCTAGNNIDTLHTDFEYERIYRVVKDRFRSDGTLWMGTRNIGLYRCLMNGDSIIMQKGYEIPENRQEYSPYDIYPEKAGVFVGTSNGFYMIPEGRDTLELIYPDTTYAGWQKSRPFVVSGIKRFSSRYLVASSDNGVLRVDLQAATGGKVKAIGEQCRIKNIVLRDEAIYALGEEVLYIIDIEGNILKSISLENPADFYHHVPETGMSCFINREYMSIVQDMNIDKPEEYKKVKLRRETRPECRNIVANIPSMNNMLLVTGNALFRIAYNLDIFNSIGAAHTIAADGEFIYFLIGKRVFRANCNDIGTKEANIQHVINIPEEYEIEKFSVVNGQIYFIDNSNNTYTINSRITGDYYRNTITAVSSIVPLVHLDKDVTAFGRGGLLCGIRDSIITIDPAAMGEEIKLYTDKNSGTTINDPYITLFEHNGDETWIATLNDGMYRGKGKEFEIVKGSTRYKFINDIAFTASDNRPYVLTNHYVYTPDGNDSIRADGYRRLVITDENHIYGIGEFGITRFLFSPSGNRREEYYTDVKFNPAATIAVNRDIIAGSDCGVFLFRNPDELAQMNGKSLLFETVAFENFLEYLMYAEDLILFCIAIALISRWFERRRYSKARKVLEEQKRLLWKTGTRQAVRLIADSEKSMSLTEVNSQIERNNCWIKQNRENRESIEGIISFLSASARIKGFTDELSAEALCVKKLFESKSEEEAVRNVRTMLLRKGQTMTAELTPERIDEFESKTIGRLCNRWNNIGSKANCDSTREYINKMIKELDEKIKKEIKNENRFKSIKERWKELLLEVDNIKGNAKKMRSLLVAIKTFELRAGLRRKYFEICKLTEDYNCNLSNIKEKESIIAKSTDDELSKVEKAKEKISEYENNNKGIALKINESIKTFYKPIVEENIDFELFGTMGLSASNCRNCSNNAKIVLLLLTGVKIENKEIQELLLKDPDRKEDMRKERSIAEQEIARNFSAIRKYGDKHPDSLARTAYDAIAEIFCKYISRELNNLAELKNIQHIDGVTEELKNAIENAEMEKRLNDKKKTDAREGLLEVIDNITSEEKRQKIEAYLLNRQKEIAEGERTGNSVTERLIAELKAANSSKKIIRILKEIKHI